MSWKCWAYLSWFTVEEGSQRLREMGMLEWICHLGSAHPNWEGPEDIAFTNIMRDKS